MTNFAMLSEDKRLFFRYCVIARTATFTKFGKPLHEFQLPKRFRLHVTSRLIFFIMQIGKIADIFPKNPLKNVPCANI